MSLSLSQCPMRNDLWGYIDHSLLQVSTVSMCWPRQAGLPRASPALVSSDRPRPMPAARSPIARPLALSATRATDAPLAPCAVWLLYDQIVITCCRSGLRVEHALGAHHAGLVTQQKHRVKDLAHEATQLVPRLGEVHALDVRQHLLVSQLTRVVQGGVGNDNG